MRKAFTLIELLIVMTVIAILAGILIPSFRGFQSEAWLVKAEGDISSLQVGVEAYFRSHDNQYPEKIEDLLTSTPRYIPSMPKDPFRTKGSDYGYEVVYRKPGNEPYYVIYSQGPNRVKNWSWDALKGQVVLEQNSDDILFTNAVIQ